MKMTFLILAFVVIFYAGALASNVKKEFHHTFSVKPGTVLVLDHGDGNVHIKVWDKDEVQVDVRYDLEVRGMWAGRAEDFEVEFDERGDQIFVRSNESGRNFFGIGSVHYNEYRYEIKAPAYLELDAIGEDGDMIAEGITGNLKIKLDDGDIDLRNITNAKTELNLNDGKVFLENITSRLKVHGDDSDVKVRNCKFDDSEIRVADGRIKVYDSDGPMYVSSSDGDILLNHVNSSKVEARSQDGNVDLRLNSGGPVSIYVSTSDGRVNLSLPREVSAHLSIETDDGGIHFDLDDAKISREKENSLKGELGDGEGEIQIRTNDGSVYVSND